MQANKNKFSINDTVRFTDERLSFLAPLDRKRLEGRIGLVQSYWNYTRKPVVYFPEEGNRTELRLLGVDPKHLELVEASSLSAAIEPSVNDGKLSQSDTDNLFG